MAGSRLETRVRYLTIAILCGSILLLLGTVAAVVSPRLRQALGFASDSPRYVVGDRIDIPSDAYQAAAHTLVVFARASCEACQAIRPVLVDLVREIGRSEDVRVSVIMPTGSPVEGMEYVRELGLSESSFFPQTLRDFKVRKVPTALLVDRRGTILAISEGAGEPLRDFAKFVLLRMTAS